MAAVAAFATVAVAATVAIVIDSVVGAPDTIAATAVVVAAAAAAVVVDAVVDADVDDVICCAGGRGNRRRNHECLSADDGVIRYSGSHSRQPHKKFINNGSSHPFNALRKLFEPGGPRSLP